MQREYEPYRKTERRFSIDLPPQESTESALDWEERVGQGREVVVGMIGRGEKAHDIAITYIDAEYEDYAGRIHEVRVIISARSWCGSQRWSMGGGYSPLRIIGSKDNHDVDCKKCNKGRI